MARQDPSSVISISSDSEPSSDNYPDFPSSEDDADFEEPIRFVKKFTKRDLRILYLPLWFVSAAKLYSKHGRKCMNFCVRYGEDVDREDIVRINHRPKPNPIVHELAGDWKFFTRANQMRAKKWYSIEFVQGGAMEWSYIRVNEA